MAMKSVPIELMIRRFKVKELYAAGYKLVDIARYYEVPTTYIRKSLESLSEYGLEPLEKKNISYVIEDVLAKRDEELKGLNEKAIREKGFWRKPSVFSDFQKEADKEIAIQKELRTIGIRPKEICSYRNYGDDLEKIVVYRSQTNTIFEEQKKLAIELVKDGWVYEDIMEFCGISITRLVKREEIIEVRDKSKMLGYKKIADIAKKLYDEYYADESMTHQKLAQKYGLTRRTVITYMEQYRIDNSLEKREKKKSHGNGEKRVKENVISQLKEKYLVMEEDGKYQFAYDESSKRYTIERVAKELGVTELTVMKYKKRINEENNK